MVLFTHSFLPSRSSFSSMSYSMKVSVSRPNTSSIRGWAEPCSTAHRLPASIISTSLHVANRNCGGGKRNASALQQPHPGGGRREWRNDFYQLEEADPDHRLLFFLLTSVWKRRPGSFHISLRLNSSKDSCSQMFTHFSLSLEAIMVLRKGNEKTLRGAQTKWQRFEGLQPVWIYGKHTKRLHACVYAANELQEYKDKNRIAVFLMFCSLSFSPIQVLWK